VELTVESLIAELGLELASGHEAAQAHVRWVHSTELADPTPWLRGGELLLTTGLQLSGPKSQRELIERLADGEIAAVRRGSVTEVDFPLPPGPGLHAAAPGRRRSVRPRGAGLQSSRRALEADRPHRT